MSPTEASEPIYYNSLYRHGVDEKRRVQIPAKWFAKRDRSDKSEKTEKSEHAEEKFMLILQQKTPHQEPCLLVLPPKQTKAYAEKLASLPWGDPKAEALRRHVGANSDLVTVDKSGRIMLTEHLAEGAGIEKEAVLVGMWDRFQIWSPERLKAAEERDKALAAEAQSLI